MKSKKMNESLDTISTLMFGRSQSVAKASHTCVSCGEAATVFTDDISEREYKISGLCQICQDEIFE